MGAWSGSNRRQLSECPGITILLFGTTRGFPEWNRLFSAGHHALDGITPSYRGQQHGCFHLALAVDKTLNCSWPLLGHRHIEALTLVVGHAGLHWRSRGRLELAADGVGALLSSSSLTRHALPLFATVIARCLSLAVGEAASCTWPLRVLNLDLQRLIANRPHAADRGGDDVRRGRCRRLSCWDRCSCTAVRWLRQARAQQGLRSGVARWWPDGRSTRPGRHETAGRCRVWSLWSWSSSGTRNCGCRSGGG